MGAQDSNLSSRFQLVQLVTMQISILVIAFVVAGADPCCQTCEPPLVKYYSVDVAHGFCGECCTNPKDFDWYKKFEANLTLVEEGSDHGPCKDQFVPDGSHYSEYTSTVTHGVPGIVSATLDLYAPANMPDHDCCVTPLIQSLNCFGIPGKSNSMSIRGTGPYCCPSSATEENPCGSSVVV